MTASPRASLAERAICIDVSPAVHGRAGIGRYVQQLTAALLAAAPEQPCVVFYNRAAQAHPEPPLDGLPAVRIALADKPWRLRVLLGQLTRRPQDNLLPGVDLFHASDHVLPCLKHIASVFTVYDLTFAVYPETQTRLNCCFLRLAFPCFLRAADAIIAISESTRRDLVRLFGLSNTDIHVVYGATDARFRPAADEAVAGVRAKYRLPERFVLFVGTIEPRKNLALLLEAIHTLRQGGTSVPLVIAGRPGWHYRPFMDRLHQLALGELVTLLGPVPDVDLPTLYTAAEAFVFPSLYEGFGLPVLEAMACGTPVMASRAASLPEVSGDAALLIDPHDVRQLAAALRQVWGDPALRAELRGRGWQQARRFSWEETARQTLQVYQEARQRAHARRT